MLQTSQTFTYKMHKLASTFLQCSLLILKLRYAIPENKKARICFTLIQHSARRCYCNFFAAFLSFSYCIHFH